MNTRSSLRVSFGALAIASAVALVTFACGSDTKDGDGTTGSTADDFCSKALSAINNCPTSKTCDKISTSNCSQSIAQYNAAYVSALTNCAFTCGDAGASVDDTCAAAAITNIAPTASFTALANAYCGACPATNCVADFTGMNDAGDSTGAFLRIFDDSFIDGLRTTCTTSIADASPASGGCVEAFFACEETYEKANTFQGSSCDDDGGTSK